MGSKTKVKKIKEGSELKNYSKKKEAKEHIGALRQLSEKDPDFYEYLKEHDKELLEFDEESINDDTHADIEKGGDEDPNHAEHYNIVDEKEEKPSKNVITSTMVDTWCNEIRDGVKIGAIRSLLRAFQAACHYGDDGADDPTIKFGIMSSNVFNKIMVYVLTEIDGVFRGLLKLPPGGDKKTIMDLVMTKRWKIHNNLVKSYLGNSLHVLNQMTDNEMITFMLKRLRDSSIFLAAYPALLRKYIKVALHFWGTGSGVLPVVSFLFLRDLSVQLGSDCLDDCVKGMYKSFVMNCHNFNPAKLQHIQFLSNCFIELLRVDIPSAYHHAFVYIRQLAMILKEALSCSSKKNSAKTKEKEEPSSKTVKKETFRKVYQWKYIICLELWTGVVCAYVNEADLSSLAYPLTQIIVGVVRLRPSACYFPVRLRCISMLNRISASSNTFVPVSLLLLDMLEMKELRRPATGGVGKAVDLGSILKVSKSTLTTRAFQEACVFCVIRELAEHLVQWSYSIAFSELSFVPSVRLRNLCKVIKVERFHREIKHLIRQIEVNSDFIQKKRITSSLLPNDIAASSFLENEKMSGTSPLSHFVATLRQRAKEKNDALLKSSVLVGERSSKFRNKITEDDEFDDDSGSEESMELLLPGGNSVNNRPRDVKKNYMPSGEASLDDDDIVEDFIFSSDEDSPRSNRPQEVKSPTNASATSSNRGSKKRKKPLESSKEKLLGIKRSKKNKKKVGMGR